MKFLPALLLLPAVTLSQQAAEFTVGDEVIIGEVALGETACITTVNPDGSYQVDYQDGETANEQVDAPDASASVSHLARDCRTGLPPAAGGGSPIAVESSSDVTGAPIG